MKSPLIIEPTKTHYHSVIWLHGLGADATDFLGILPHLKQTNQAHVRWIFPYAPEQAVTINGGIRMPSWFDITSPDLQNGSNLTDIEQSVSGIGQLIDEEARTLGHLDKVHLAGFSQGGVIALSCAGKYAVGSVLALSCYLPKPDRLDSATNTTIMMMHGYNDPVVPFTAGLNSYQSLAALGVNVQWKTYTMDHELCPEQLVDIDLWFSQQLKS